MAYSVYILKSEKDQKLYIGSTSDLEERLKRHHRGAITSTKYRRPLFLVYEESCSTLKEARSRELELKKGSTKLLYQLTRGGAAR